MKKLFYFIIGFLILACNSENAPDCFKAEGTIIQSEINVDVFTKIVVHNKVQLFIKDGPEQKIILETGENIINDIDINVTDSLLVLKNNISCNLVRDYGITKVYVTTPNITEIRSSSEFTVTGLNKITYPNLSLFSEDSVNDEFYSNGDFELDLEVDYFTIIANGYSNFFLTGTANQAYIGLFAGDSRVEAENFIIQNLNVYHRSTNKMIVNPQQYIKGEIRGIGDIISKNVPLEIDVEEYYTGKLIFD